MICDRLLGATLFVSLPPVLKLMHPLLVIKLRLMTSCQALRPILLLTSLCLGFLPSLEILCEAFFCCLGEGTILKTALFARVLSSCNLLHPLLMLALCLLCSRQARRPIHALTAQRLSFLANLEVLCEAILRCLSEGTILHATLLVQLLSFLNLLHSLIMLALCLMCSWQSMCPIHVLAAQCLSFLPSLEVQCKSILCRMCQDALLEATLLPRLTPVFKTLHPPLVLKLRLLTSWQTIRPVLVHPSL
mmetsp:Transcript_56823/g.90361  ORF Transcript_56823/g.90361 Transcript_56823/m.90361 type:complete len:247 (+) Transcript_56823:359-1099(+)